MTRTTRSALLAAAISTAIAAGAWADTVTPGRDDGIKIPKPGAPAPADPSNNGAAEFQEWELLIASCIDAHEQSLFDLIPMIEPMWERGDKPARQLSDKIQGVLRNFHMKFQAERSAPNRDQRSQPRMSMAHECTDSLMQIKREVAALLARSGGKRTNSFFRPKIRPYSERMGSSGQNH